MGQPVIRDAVGQVLILAYKEDTSRLEAALSREGLTSRVIRPDYSAQELTYSQTVRVLINHLNAWRLCASRDDLTIVLEADFVPCKGFGGFPLPFSQGMSSRAWGWLYACGMSIYELVREGAGIHARGHSAAPVATVFGPEAARILVEFAERELRESDPYSYSYWDTYARVYLQERGVSSYMTFRNYGEHGGVANPEHRTAGLSASAHRADVLMGRLHFLPAYARGSMAVFLWVRLLAKVRGLGRLLCLRVLEKPALLGSSQRLELIQYAVSRLLSLS